MSKLTGKTAVITGGNSGIGLATARLFLSKGARVIITGRNADAIKKTVEDLGDNAYGIVSDAGKMADLRNLAESVGKITNSVDIVFANAGVGLFVPFDQTSEEIFDSNVDINFKGAYFTVQKLLPLMQAGSSVILNSTILVHSGLSTASSYAASKGAVLALAKSLGAELADRQIRVNCISPGPIDTPIYEKMGMPEEALAAFAAGVQAKVPLKRFGASDDIAQAALFLASSDSGFMTGSEITVDGGKAIAF